MEICDGVFCGFATQMVHVFIDSGLLCRANGPLLQGKRATVGEQNDYSCKAKGLLLQKNEAFCEL